MGHTGLTLTLTLLLKTSTGGNLIWATSSTSAGSERKVNFLDIFCNLFTFHFFFTPVPNGARHSLAYRLDSTSFTLYHDQVGLVQGRQFPIKRGVKQGDVLSPLLFNAGLEPAMRKWKLRIQHCGLHCGHNELLTNVRYADDLMLYARSDTILQVWWSAWLRNWQLPVYI